MQITKINIPSEQTEHVGLKAIEMKKLGQMVLIAGKNGSGKTRLLNKIKNTLANKPSASEIYNINNNTKHNLRNIEIETQNIKNYESQAKKVLETSLEFERINKEIKNAKTLIDKEWQSQIDINNKRINWDFIETSEILEFYKIIDFVPKRLELTDVSDLGKSQLSRYASDINSVGVEHLPQGTFAKIQQIQNRWWSATHQNTQVSEEERNKAIEDYNNLKDLVQKFLNTELGRNLDDEATLFGFPLGRANLSDGQKVLIQFCLAIYSQKTALKDLILFMDEPENHLHPSALLEAIDRIKEFVTNGQIWIATHSINILAHYDPSYIWYIENGQIDYAGRIPEKVLAGLMGSEEEIAKLSEFLSLPAEFASNRFAYESLFPPLTVGADVHDPQTRQIRQIIQNLIETGQKIKILDFGSGKGRLISTIYESEESSPEKDKDWLEYVAFDPDPKDKEYCENAISMVYGSANKRYYNHKTQFMTDHDAGSFNLIVMCNVFHEINPNDWLRLFSPEDMIQTLLKEDGTLLIVEDQRIPVGEKAYQNGFLVFDSPQFRDLFGIPAASYKFNDARGDGRLKAHFINKAFLSNITPETRCKAIRSLNNTAKDEIKRIRSLDTPSFKEGILHGFWVQQYANAQIVVDELCNRN